MPVQLGPRAIDVHLTPLTVELHDVLHAAGTSSQTVSTCAVCGNMSKATSDSIA
jgi:hypothetical protein